jgi:hypothetical protein
MGEYYFASKKDEIMAAIDQTEIEYLPLGRNCLREYRPALAILS